MKEAALFSKLSFRLENNKKLKWTIYALLIVAAIIIFLSSIGGMINRETESHATSKETDKTDLQIYNEKLELRLESILAGMRGVGRVKVMITFDSTEEMIVASDEQISENENGSSKSKRPSTVTSSSGEEAIVLKELLPKICGVIVIAEGAGDIAVNMDIVAAVSTVLGIKQSNVQVFEMNKKTDWN